MLAESPARCAYAETYLHEAEIIAHEIDAAWRTWPQTRSPGARPTTAVLVRARSQIAAIERAAVIVRRPDDLLRRAADEN